MKESSALTRRMYGRHTNIEKMKSSMVLVDMAKLPWDLGGPGISSPPGISPQLGAAGTGSLPGLHSLAALLRSIQNPSASEDNKEKQSTTACCSRQKCMCIGEGSIQQREPHRTAFQRHRRSGPFTSIRPRRRSNWSNWSCWSSSLGALVLRSRRAGAAVERCMIASPSELQLISLTQPGHGCR
ncbi:hypothetical protein BO71DRAFT_104300 [Aspergillus ellipticus CBS 707.79]|uniref:Uncharacterized protein n=1 Tax=Aspergillus ellipticus CBS 707.79 TaxID=1448320 RepID=A0A319CY81_9EURO|nr:hypothetical protein BO71DRAFT_104300 [Aspergillus ellipticus CBS 707.79]